MKSLSSGFCAVIRGIDYACCILGFSFACFCFPCSFIFHLWSFGSYCLYRCFHPVRLLCRMVCLFSPCVVVAPLQKNMQGGNNVLKMFFCFCILFDFALFIFLCMPYPVSFDALQLLKRRLTPLLFFTFRAT